MAGQIAALEASDLAAMNTLQYSVMTTAQVGAITSLQAAALEGADLSALSVAQVRAMAEHFAKLDETGKLAGLFAAPSGLAPEPAAVAETEEGWILGA